MIVITDILKRKFWCLSFIGAVYFLMSSGRLGTLYCLWDASKSRKILDPPVMIPSEAPTDNVWNAGVVTDCWRFLSLVSTGICQLLLQSTQHEPTFYNQFSLVCNRKKTKTSTIILFTVIVNFFFPTILKTSWSVLRLTLDVIRQREKISVIRYFWCPFVLPYL